MANQIVVKHRSGSSGEPSGLLTGEVAANLLDKHLYIGTGSGNIVFKDSTTTQPISQNLTDLSALSVALGDTIRGDGANLVSLKNNVAAIQAPSANDDSGSGYAVGSQWIDITNDKAYICVDASSTAAVWSEITPTVTDTVITDADFATSGLMTTDGLGGYSVTTLDTNVALGTSETAVPTQNAVKQYVDNLVTGGVTYQGAYSADTNIPNLDTSPTPGSILKGFMYTVTAPGALFTVDLEVGDVLIAEVADPATINDWTIVQRNIINDQLIDGGTY